MTKCPACLERFGPDGQRALAEHLATRAGASDSDHVRWLNQNVGRRRTDAAGILRALVPVFSVGPGGLAGWIRGRFVSKFFGAVPHPFVAALQRPARPVLLGYVVEHQHFLRQWVRSCAHITAATDDPDVIRYELDNLVTEFGGSGPDRPSHYELLLRMGEGLGLPRDRVLATPPLPATRRAIDGWEAIARNEPWVETMAAMHSLELIAHRDLVRDGATLHYFDPAILDDGTLASAARAFLREGYDADVGHSEEALALIARHATDAAAREDLQSTFLRSIDLFDDYLIARLQRANDYAA